MNVVITGSSFGIGKEAAKKFLSRGYVVYGIDIARSTIPYEYNYHHFRADVSNAETLPDIEDVHILINNAGIQTEDSAAVNRDIDVNLIGTINCTEKYAILKTDQEIRGTPEIRSVINLASVSAHNGAEFSRYCASKGGILAYTKYIARHLAPKQATCNSLSFGGVCTELNAPVMKDQQKWAAIMDETPMRKWCTAEEAAEWIYFVSVINRSMTAQDIIIDNGEMYNHNFVWE